MNNFSSRLLYYIDNELNISVREFEKKIHLAQGSIQRAINGTNMGIDKLQLISQHCPELNMDWLISGEGDMIDNIHRSIAQEPKVNYDTPVQSAILIIAESNKTLSETNAKITEKLLMMITQMEMA